MMCTVWHSCSCDFSVCNSFHPVLALQLLSATVPKVLSLHTHQTHKRGSAHLYLEVFNGYLQCYNAWGVMLCYLLLWETISTERNLPVLLQARVFTLGNWLCAVSPPFLFTCFTSSRTPFHMLGTNLAVWRCENLKKKKLIYFSWLLPSKRKYFSSNWQSFKQWESYLLCLFARCNAKRSLEHQKNNHYPMFWWCCLK